jgi:acyl-ACP thioesterase
MDRCPEYGETVKVTTWPSSRSTLFVTRDFEMTDPSGSLIAVATTSWAVLDLSSKRPVGISKVVPEAFVMNRHVIESGFSQMPKLDSFETRVEIPVMLRDLDLNEHVNHIVYVQWALEAIPLHILQTKSPRSIEVSYRAEARFGDRILSSSIKDPAPDCSEDTYHHAIINASTGAELSRLRTVWA